MRRLSTSLTFAVFHRLNEKVSVLIILMIAIYIIYVSIHAKSSIAFLVNPNFTKGIIELKPITDSEVIMANLL